MVQGVNVLAEVSGCNEWLKWSVWCGSVDADVQARAAGSL